VGGAKSLTASPDGALIVLCEPLPMRKLIDERQPWPDGSHQIVARLPECTARV
jgi:hypothetical protein